jgi:hypothetical protein
MFYQLQLLLAFHLSTLFLLAFRPSVGSYLTSHHMADKPLSKAAAARKRQYPVARVKGSWCEAEDEALKV